MAERRSAQKKASENGEHEPGAAKADLVIAGGGYVGLCIALSVKQAAPHLKIAVIDAIPAEAIENDTRASAIAAAAVRMLEAIGIWSEVEADTQPINEMIVTDSRLNDVARPVFLTFANDVVPGAAPSGPFAHMLPNRSLIKALRRASLALGVELINGDSISGFKNTGSGVEVQSRSGKVWHARLLVAADGVRSKLRELAGIRTIHWPYDQMGIVVTVCHERPHEGRAEEHFLPAGPFAILPLPGNRSSLVWTECTADAKRLVECDALTFDLELERRFGHKLGAISVEGERKAFPLGLTLARDYVRERFVLAGDAAHGVHPIAGQGLNLGFKDAAALAETIVEADRLGLDFGLTSVLERYQMWRRFETVQMGVTTDVLNRLFSNDNPILRIARDVGLGAVDRMPGLKRYFISQAAGNRPGLPRLLQGSAI
ncbi:MAG: ubiquinone biosynthesis hydroxylase [Rhizobiaceae bacterium]